MEPLNNFPPLDKEIIDQLEEHCKKAEAQGAVLIRINEMNEDGFKASILGSPDINVAAVLQSVAVDTFQSAAELGEFIEYMQQVQAWLASKEVPTTTH